MNTQNAYNIWANQYDSNENPTRDLEAKALREILTGQHADHCLELGCGTGKNTEWLVNIVRSITAVDLSESMLEKARQKIQAPGVRFLQADLLSDWDFAQPPYDLVVFSLVLEHVEDLEPIFRKTTAVLAPGGYVYVGELHPFKQYLGSKARFDTGDGTTVVNCYNHHISDFVQAAAQHDLSVVLLREYFDDNNRSAVPRILSILFRKTESR